MKKLYVALFIACSAFKFSSCLAQFDNQAETTTYSPEAYAATRLKNVPINPFTGQVNWSVPLYEKKMSVLNLSIILTYIGGGGLKVDDPGSLYGKGWALKYGGAVVRDIRGTRDEVISTYENNDGYQYLNLYQHGVLSIADGDYGVPVAISSQYFDLVNYSSNSSDSQHDIFEFNLPNGVSGKFYIGNNLQILQVPQSGLKITPFFSPISELLSFTIVDESGIVYYFNQMETTAGGASDSWLLTRIEAPSNEESIDFTYDADASASYSPNHSETISGYANTPPIFLYNANNAVQPNLIRSISFSDNTTVSFFYGTYGFSGDVSSINIYSGSNLPLKTYLFDYKYWISANQAYYTGVAVNDMNGSGPNDYLQTIKEAGSAGTISNLYSFDYYLGANFNEVSFTNDLDIWGYHNGKNNVSPIPCFPEPTPADRSIDINYAIMGALKQIIYKTGAIEKYEYESNQKRVNNVSQVVGGIRLKTRYFYTDRNSTQPQITQFNYNEDDGISSGFLGDTPVFSNVTYSYDDQWPTQKNIQLTKYYASSAPVNPLSTVEGSSVGYRRVEETMSDGGSGNNGKIVYEYSDMSFVDMSLWSPINTFPYRPVDRPTWAVGLPLTTTYYAANGNIVKQTVNQYDISQSTVNDVNFRSVYVASEGTNAVGSIGQNIFKVLNYYPVQGRSNLIKTTETNYSSSNPASYVQNITQYAYGPNAILRDKFTTNYKGDIIHTMHFYPFDYTLGSGSFTDYMLQKNMLRLPVSTETILERSGNYSLISASVMEYSTGNMIRPINIYNARLAQPVANFSTTYLNASTFLQPGANMQLSSSNQYDSNGRLINQQTDGGIKKGYVLNTRGEIIGESINADVSTIAFTSFEDDEDLSQWSFDINSVNTTEGFSGLKSYTSSITKSGLPTGNYLVSLWAKGTGTINVNSTSQIITSQWKQYKFPLTSVSSVTVSGNGNKIDDIKIYPAESQLMTHVYKAGVGALSQSDGKGNTSFFEYDDLNRIKNLKDQYGNILKNYAYHDITFSYSSAALTQTYSPDVAPCPYGKVALNPITCTIPAGKFTSDVSQADADAKAQQDLAVNGYIYADATGGCLIQYSNAQQSAEFAKTGCGNGAVATTVSYTVYAGIYKSTVSQQAADDQALADISSRGQTVSNGISQCIYPTTVTIVNNTSANYSVDFNSRLGPYGYLPDYVYQCPPGTTTISVPDYTYTISFTQGAYSGGQGAIGVTSDISSNPQQNGVFPQMSLDNNSRFYINYIN